MWYTGRARGVVLMRIELNCAVCGSNRFSLERYAEDDSNVSCEDYGHEIGTLRSLKERIADEVMKRSVRT